MKILKAQEGIKWNKYWLKHRKKQFKENLESSTEEQKKLFKNNNSDSINNQIFNLQNTQVFNDRTSFNNSTSGENQMSKFDEKALIGGGMARQGTNGKTSIYIDKRADDGTKIHEFTHSYSRIPDLNSPHDIEIMTPQDAKVKQIQDEAPQLFYDKEDSKDEYSDRPNEVTSEIMRSRYELKLSPKHKVSLDEIQNWRENDMLPYTLSRYSNDVLLRMYNEVAYNSRQNNYNQNYYARKGIKLLPRKSIIQRFKERHI